MNDIERARLKWLCRRGMRELDLILDGWLERCYDSAQPSERQAFCELLERPDPQIFDFLTDRDAPDSAAMKDLVDALKRLHNHAHG